MAKRDYRWVCGFCANGHLRPCVGEVRNGANAERQFERCSCHACAAGVSRFGNAKAGELL